MWNKIYLAALAIALLAMGVLTYFSASWLQSLTKPVDVAASYEYYQNIYSSFLWISSLVLLILANVLLWKLRKSWALWTTFLYFAVFVLLQGWWLGALYLDFKQRNNLTQESFSLTGLVGAVLCVAAAVGIFFDQFLVLRMRDRMFGADKPIDGNSIEEKSTGEEV